MADNIYGEYKSTLELVRTYLLEQLKLYGNAVKEETGASAYEHVISRIKSPESMREKCVRKGLPLSIETMLQEIHDAVGIHIVCRFVDDIYAVAEQIGRMPYCRIAEIKDYIKDVKPNGYRSYHIIVVLELPGQAGCDYIPGLYYAEIQLRTIAMDSWASLEHEMKYKKDIANPEMISRELKRCADELASCDLSMQTIRNLIHGK